MSANELETLLFVLVGANVVLMIVAIVGSQLRSRRARALSPANPARTNSHGGNGVAIAPSTINREYAGPGMHEPEQLAPSTDQLTGLLRLTEWQRLVAEEDVRQARYGRPATIVMIEIDGLDRLVTALGQLAADRVLTAVADTIRRHARKADHVGRLGPRRFGVLLPETDEVAAISYVERVRSASDLWLESGAISLRLAIGWASPVVDSSLANAQAQALERMFVEMHRRALRSRRAEAGVSPSMPGIEGAPSAM